MSMCARVIMDIISSGKQIPVPPRTSSTNTRRKHMSYLDELHARRKVAEKFPRRSDSVIVPGLEVHSWGNFHSPDDLCPKGTFQRFMRESTPEDRKRAAQEIIYMAFGRT